MKPFIHHLLGETRTALLAVLLMHPERAQPVRELMRITGMSPGTLHRELNALVGYGLLLREAVGNQVFYRANPECPVTPELTGLIRKTAGVVDVLREALAPIADRIEAAFVYGSMAKGSTHAHSDVDVMLIGTLGFADAVLALEPAQASLRRDINPTVLTRGQFAERLRETGSFIASIWKEPKLWLKGNADELG
jgi:DNA-binding transcriptional ArsR family regulator